MPLFTYQCQRPSCGHMQEAIQKYNDREKCPLPHCDKCGNTEPMLWVGRIERSHFKVNGGHNSEYSKTGPRKG